MSPNGPTAIPVSPVNDMVAALNAALASHARLPEVEAALAQQNAINEKQAYHNQRLEENILGYKNTIADLTSKVRSLEVERDDAGFRTLEAEDKLSVLLRDVRNAVSNLDASVVHVDPPKPEPSVAEPAKVEGLSDAGPIANSSDASSQNAAIAQEPASASTQERKPTSYEPFTPPPATAKPVEITEDRKPDEFVGRANDPNWTEGWRT